MVLFTADSGIRRVSDMPRSTKLGRRQRGVVLVVGLLLLIVMTLIAVATMSSTHMQERMAGNARTQVLAFEAASAGASTALQFFDSQQIAFAARADADGKNCGDLEHLGWLTADGDPDPTPWSNPVTINGAELRQRMYCLALEDPAGERPLRSQLFVLSRGEVISDGVPVARRDIEVRIALGGNAPPTLGDGCGSLCFPGCPNPDNVVLDLAEAAEAGGKSFRVDGSTGPGAITAGCPTFSQAFVNEIGDSRMGAYYGGVQTGAAGAPWDSAADTQAFVDNLRGAAQMNGMYVGSGAEYAGNTAFGSSAAPQITFIDGDLDISGAISGAGVLVVNGSLSTSGTPNFDGLWIVLGGTLNVDGGGQGGNFSGSIVVLDGPAGSPPQFGDSRSVTVQGGGKARYLFDCNTLLGIRSGLLDSAAQDLWTPACEIPESGGTGTPPLAVPRIVSWRENLGWRELLLDITGN